MFRDMWLTKEIQQLKQKLENCVEPLIQDFRLSITRYNKKAVGYNDMT